MKMSMKKSVWVAIAAISLVVALSVPAAMAKQYMEASWARYTDPSGAAVNGAKVTVTSQTKNVSVRTPPTRAATTPSPT